MPKLRAIKGRRTGCPQIWFAAPAANGMSTLYRVIVRVSRFSYQGRAAGARWTLTDFHGGRSEDILHTPVAGIDGGVHLKARTPAARKVEPIGGWRFDHTGLQTKQQNVSRTSTRRW